MRSGKSAASTTSICSASSSSTRSRPRRWSKRPGEAVAADEPVVELETDKVTVEVPAPASGVLAEILAKDGETVAPGALLGQIQEGGAPAKAAATPAKAAPAPAPAKAAP